MTPEPQIAASVSMDQLYEQVLRNMDATLHGLSSAIAPAATQLPPSVAG